MPEGAWSCGEGSAECQASHRSKRRCLTACGLRRLERHVIDSSTLRTPISLPTVSVVVSLSHRSRCLRQSTSECTTDSLAWHSVVAHSDAPTFVPFQLRQANLPQVLRSSPPACHQLPQAPLRSQQPAAPQEEAQVVVFAPTTSDSSDRKTRSAFFFPLLAPHPPSHHGARTDPHSVRCRHVLFALCAR